MSQASEEGIPDAFESTICKQALAKWMETISKELNVAKELMDQMKTVQSLSALEDLRETAADRVKDAKYYSGKLKAEKERLQGLVNPHQEKLPEDAFKKYTEVVVEADNKLCEVMIQDREIQRVFRESQKKIMTKPSSSATSSKAQSSATASSSATDSSSTAPPQRNTEKGQMTEEESAQNDEEEEEEEQPRENATAPIKVIVNVDPVPQLPAIPLPKFSGKAWEWSDFWALFEAQIHYNTKLDEIQKFNYLRASLTGGRAQQIARKYRVTEKNYDQLVNKLLDEFNDEAKISRELLKQFEMLKARDSSTKGQRSLLDDIEAVTSQLHNMELQVGVTEPLMLLKKFHPRIQRFVLTEKNKRKGSEKNDGVMKLEWMIEKISDYLDSQEDIDAFMDPEERDNKNGNSQNRSGKGQNGKHQKGRNESPTTSRPEQTSGREYFCVFCKEKHNGTCPKVKGLSEKKQILMDENRCLGCLKVGHFISECPHPRTCAPCGEKHHFSICPKATKGKNSSDNNRKESKKTGAENKTGQQKATVAAVESHRSSRSIVFSALVPVLNQQTGRFEELPVLVDSGSNKTFIEATIAEKLNSPLVRTTRLQMDTVGGQTMCNEVVSVIIRDVNGQCHPLEVYKRKNLCGSIRTHSLTEADRQFLKNRKIDIQSPIGSSTKPAILLGTDYWQLVAADSISLPSGPILFPTNLGTIIGGPILTDHQSNNATVAMTIGEEQSEQHWDPAKSVEDSPVADNEYTGTEKDEKRLTEDKVTRDFLQSLQKREDGYYVALTWREGVTSVPDNLNMAISRLNSVLKFLKQHPEQQELYFQNQEAQLKAKMIEKVDINIPVEGKVHYLPIQIVWTPHKETTKLRVVIDASSHVKGQPSLNDLLHPGKVMLPHQIDILCRFRVGPVAFIADVEKAFHQLRLQESDRDACRFLGIKDASKSLTRDNIQGFRHGVLPFGLNCSPSMLGLTIDNHIRKSDTVPEKWKEHMISNLYVDNYIGTVSSIQEGKELYDMTKAVYNELHMNMRDFLSNSKELNEYLRENDKAKNKNMKVLGILWETEKDILTREIKIPKMPDKLSKKAVASSYHSIYDPDSLLLPLILPGKKLARDMWKQYPDWKDILRPEDQTAWKKFCKSIDGIKISVPRQIGTHNGPCQLIAFSDANGDAMASCIYMVTERGSFLLKARSQISPIMTIPKMELHAMLLGLEDPERIVIALEHTMKPQRMYILTDSEICLAWLLRKVKSKDAGVLVRNRVKSIKNIAKNIRAKEIEIRLGHVATELNPADAGTRGLDPDKFQSHFWLTGPRFINEPESTWTSQCQPFGETEPGEELLDILAQVEANDDDREIIRFSRLKAVQRLPTTGTTATRLTQAIRILVYALRFVKQVCKRSKNAGLQTLLTKYQSVEEDKGAAMAQTEAEQELATGILLRHHQENHLTPRMRTQLKYLKLQKDKHGIVRSMGRFNKSELPEEAKTPIIVAAKTELATILIKDTHEMEAHQGVSHVMSTIRQKYWIPKLRQQVVVQLKGCLTCKKENALPFKYPEMTDLPSSRVTRARPFENTGLDYFGPLQIHEGDGIGKAFGCLFTCLVTRLVHIELVPNGSTISFLSAMRRFFARRGVPSKIISDNAPTFLLGEEILRDTVIRWRSDTEVQRCLCNKAIDWCHITAYAPWQGGVYERIIRFQASMPSPRDDDAILRDVSLSRSPSPLDRSRSGSEEREPSPMMGKRAAKRQRLETLRGRNVMTSRSRSLSEEPIAEKKSKKKLKKEKLKRQEDQRQSLVNLIESAIDKELRKLQDKGIDESKKLNILLEKQNETQKCLKKILDKIVAIEEALQADSIETEDPSLSGRPDCESCLGSGHNRRNCPKSLEEKQDAWRVAGLCPKCGVTHGPRFPCKRADIVTNRCKKCVNDADLDEHAGPLCPYSGRPYRTPRPANRSHRPTFPRRY